MTIDKFGSHISKRFSQDISEVEEKIFSNIENNVLPTINKRLNENDENVQTIAKKMRLFEDKIAIELNTNVKAAEDKLKENLEKKVKKELEDLLDIVHTMQIQETSSQLTNVKNKITNLELRLETNYNDLGIQLDSSKTDLKKLEEEFKHFNSEQLLSNVFLKNRVEEIYIGIKEIKEAMEKRMLELEKKLIN
jgi:exonuclease VII large subunit